ncbi:hypothetical protein BTUL_0071g00470 [Botrytis tulipae]|uniref:Uncharacterized protein n=1 Tax=Botrytis tulipae TaxID=87230 RepID=A0A4Z1EQ13_9HELO|nr:hypothetical protein BTUL_0071g00470 [Botrytis tulipae]
MPNNREWIAPVDTRDLEESSTSVYGTLDRDKLARWDRPGPEELKPLGLDARDPRGPEIEKGELHTAGIEQRVGRDDTQWLVSETDAGAGASAGSSSGSGVSTSDDLDSKIDEGEEKQFEKRLSQE